MALHLITIWAKHEGGHGYADHPQFVAAFPSRFDALNLIEDDAINPGWEGDK